MVLANLEMRLDVLESELSLPFSLDSGHIHELRINIPWMALGSESVKVTISTIELSVSLSKDDDDSENDDEVFNQSFLSSETASYRQKPKITQSGDQQDLTPGYLESLLLKIGNNIDVEIQNLILKYVENDIVLSVNIKSIHLFPCEDENWTHGWAEISEHDPVVRRLCQIEDLTVCLDKRSSSGQISSYEEPVIYRCGITIRLLASYSSPFQRSPDRLIISTKINNLAVSLSEQQLPMLVRIAELGMALYYGKMKKPEAKDPSTGTMMTVDEIPPEESIGEDSGWVSWAWNSFVGEEEENFSASGDGLSGKTEPVVIIAQIYIELVTAKISTKRRELLFVEVTGIGIESMIKGEAWFSSIVGVTEITCSFKEDSGELTEIVHLGSALKDKTGLNYTTGSLWDFRAPENNNARSEIALEMSEHDQIWTEDYCCRRFGAFFTDYKFKMEPDLGLSTGKGS